MGNDDPLILLRLWENWDEKRLPLIGGGVPWRSRLARVKILAERSLRKLGQADTIFKSAPGDTPGDQSAGVDCHPCQLVAWDSVDAEV